MHSDNDPFQSTPIEIWIEEIRLPFSHLVLDNYVAKKKILEFPLPNLNFCPLEWNQTRPLYWLPHYILADMICKWGLTHLKATLKQKTES